MINFNKEKVLRIIGLSTITLILLNSNKFEKIVNRTPEVKTVKTRVEEPYKPVTTELPEIIQPVVKEEFEGIRTTNDNVMTNKKTYVLDKDSDEQSIIGNLRINEGVYRLFETNKGYSLIVNNNIVGYVPTESLDSVSLDTNNLVNYDEVSRSALTTTESSFRIGPADNYKVIEELQTNTELELLAKTDNDWYLARRVNNDKITLGFIESKDVKVILDEKVLIKK